MGLGFIILSLFVLNFSLSCWGDNVTISVKGNATIAQTDDTFVCATIDWWPSTKCDYGMCPWGNTSILNLDVNNTIINNAVKEFQNLRIRIGGSLQDQVLYDVGESVTNCTHGFSVSPNDLFGYTNGCLTMDRWHEVNQFFSSTGAMVTFGLNALYGRNKPTNPGDNRWKGPWDSSNARDLIQLSVSNGYPIEGWEVGNELSGAGVGASVDAGEYAEDMNLFKDLVLNLYENSSIQPKISGPSGFYDQQWFDDFLQMTDPNIVDIVSHHIYNLGAGVDPNLVERMQDPFVLDKIAQTYKDLELTVQNFAPWSSPWVSESGGAYNSGGKVSHTFGDGFWYMDMLGMSSTFGHKVFCRQSLIGGNYGLLNTTTMLPNPDYYSALLFHRLMGTDVLATFHDGSPYLRAYSHCSRTTPGITLLLINLSNSTAFNINVSNADALPSTWGESTEGERWEYHLTPKDGDIQSNTVLLNGTPLEVNSTGKIPPLNPNITSDPIPLTVAPSSIAFVIIKDFKAPACG